MATNIAEMVPALTREVNPPGGALYPDAGAGDLMGYLQDAFWDIRLAGMLPTYTLVPFGEVSAATPPTSGIFIVDIATKSESLEPQQQMLIVIFAGIRMLRLKILNLAVNFKAKAGPVEYEQQASATTLRAILDDLRTRAEELKATNSELFGGAGFTLFDGELQRSYSLLHGFAVGTVG